MAASAAAQGLAGRVRQGAAEGSIGETFTAAALVAMVARDRQALGPVADAAGWQPLAVPEGFRTWTDDYSNIIDPIMRRFRQP